MTETRNLIENWDLRDFTLKQFLDFGFPLPRFNFTMPFDMESAINEFNGQSRLKAVAMNESIPGMTIQEDAKKLIPFINQFYNITLDETKTMFKGFCNIL